jgi:uncharacterized membrane protein YdjX (TVP38/TMEM64 family)
MERVIRTIRENLYSILFLVVIFGSVYLAQIFSIDISIFMNSNPFVFGGALVILMFMSTVLAPITTLPLVPMIAPILGPFHTGLAVWIGWTLGAIVSFLIARYGGRPLLSHFVHMEKLATYESRFPDADHFFLILALRLLIPVDILSYALGVFSTVRLRTYIFASALGILWFSFAFAYVGTLVTSGNTVLFVTYGVASLIILVCAFFYVRRTLRNQ